jgi:hypothetical protein
VAIAVAVAVVVAIVEIVAIHVDQLALVVQKEPKDALGHVVQLGLWVRLEELALLEQ